MEQARAVLVDPDSPGTFRDKTVTSASAAAVAGPRSGEGDLAQSG